MSRALLIIDFQNDFTSGGALEVPGGDEIAEPVRRLAAEYAHVFATKDWHPPDHASFETEGGPWPVHCVQGTHGAELHPAMRDIEVEAIVDVGVERDDEGLATDYCVRASAIDACREGFDTTVVTDAIRAVEVEPGDGERALEDMKRAGARLAISAEIAAAPR
jgi:nicotinamidase/pyrazinamidase